MPENEPKKPEENRCDICGTSSQDRVLFQGERRKKKVWICAGCLPRVIHGAH